MCLTESRDVGGDGPWGYGLYSDPSAFSPGGVAQQGEVSGSNYRTH